LHGAIANVGSDQHLKFVNTSPSRYGMAKATKSVAAQFSASSVSVEQHELRRRSIINSDDQAIGANPSGSATPTPGKLTGALGNRWLEPQQEVIAEPVKFMEVMALHP